MKRIAMLGLGAMGSRMAHRLLNAGHTVTVWNRTRSKAEPLRAAGASLASTPRLAVKECEIAISMVRGDLASREIWLNEKTGALAGLPVGAIAVESSTLTLPWVCDLADFCRSNEIEFLDAPVAGSRPQADAGQLIFLVGGASHALENVQPILEVMSDHVLHAGKNGAGCVLKLAINGLFGIQAAAMGELIGLFNRTEFDMKLLMQLLTQTPVCSPAAAGVANAMLARAFDPLFPIDLVEKDFGYILDSAASAKANMPIHRSARQIYASAKVEGLADLNITGIAERYGTNHDSLH